MVGFAALGSVALTACSRDFEIRGTRFGSGDAHEMLDGIPVHSNEGDSSQYPDVVVGPDGQEFCKVASASVKLSSFRVSKVGGSIGSVAPAGSASDKSDKILICHKPGKLDKTLLVPQSAWLHGHSGHGDVLGSCEGQPEGPIDPNNPGPNNPGPNNPGPNNPGPEASPSPTLPPGPNNPGPINPEPSPSPSPSPSLPPGPNNPGPEASPSPTLPPVDNGEPSYEECEIES